MHKQTALAVIAGAGAAVVAGLGIALAGPSAAATPSPTATSRPAPPPSQAPVAVTVSASPVQRTSAPSSAAPTVTAPGIGVPAGNARVAPGTGASSVEVGALLGSGLALAGGGVVLALRRRATHAS